MTSEADCVWAQVGTKRRHSVVLRCLPTGKLFVIGGSSQDHDRPRVIVDRKSTAGTALKLKVRTYFYANDTAQVSKVEQMGTVCPPTLFVQLLRLVGLRS